MLNRFQKRTTAFVFLSLAFYCSAAVFADSFGSDANTFDIDFVTIGDPGNAADTTGNPMPPYQTGSVDYAYRIGKYEVSRDMVTKASIEGGLEITLDDMSGVTGGPRPDMPASGVSWNEAARFVNWLNISEGFSAAYKFGTQPGDVGYDANAFIELWEPADAGYDADNLFRNSLAQYFLPSVNEWYKAAFYDPSANGGAGGYWDFPTGSDTAPTAVASGTAAGTAVYDQTDAQGPADITQAGGLSPYGVMGQGGNIIERHETEFTLVNEHAMFRRVTRGGAWNSDPSLNSLSALRRFDVAPHQEIERGGFRVASIPEPSTLLLGVLLVCMGLLQLRRH